MKIIKTSSTQITPEQGQIVNQYQETSENTYSCNYVNVVIPKTKLLWSNPNPEAEFAAQTITIDNMDWDFLEIYFQYWNNGATDNWNQMGYMKCLYRTDKWVLLGGYNTTANGFSTPQHFFRLMKPLSKTQLQFSAGEQTTYSGQATNNKATVPYKIYGIKI